MFFTALLIVELPVNLSTCAGETLVVVEANHCYVLDEIPLVCMLFYVWDLLKRTKIEIYFGL